MVLMELRRINFLLYKKKLVVNLRLKIGVLTKIFRKLLRLLWVIFGKGIYIRMNYAV